MVIPNNYVIDKIDLSDTENFMGSKDIIEYAISREWYNPQTDGEFSFRKAYTNPGSFTHPDNIKRQWAALYKLTGKEFERNPDKFPFSVKVEEKITTERVF